MQTAFSKLTRKRILIAIAMLLFAATAIPLLVLLYRARWEALFVERLRLAGAVVEEERQTPSWLNHPLLDQFLNWRIFYRPTSVVLDKNSESTLILNLTELQTLRRLEISNADIPHQFFRRLSGCRRLERLSIWGCEFDGERLKDIGVLPLLEELTLDGGSTDDRACQWIARQPRLVELWLRRSSVTDQGARDLSNSRSLQMIDLCVTQLTDHGARHLLKLPTLSCMILELTHVSNEFIKACPVKTYYEL